MKVAIIGAGISGLSCALRLHKSGINPDIFEKNGYIGCILEHSAILPNQLVPYAYDSLKYIKRITEFDIEPFSKIQKIELIKNNKINKLSVSPGYIIKRGRDTHSLENQLAAKLDLKIFLNNYIKLNDIKDSYDKIIIASGNSLISESMGIWKENYRSQIRTALVLGDFDTKTIKVWTKLPYAESALCYLVPNSTKEATMIMFLKNIAHREIYYYWDKFITEESIMYNIIEIRDLERSSGSIQPIHSDKIIFTGNSIGFSNDFVGLGILNAMLSGFLAAESLLAKDNSGLSQKNNHLIFNQLSNMKDSIYKKNDKFMFPLKSLFGKQIKQWSYKKAYYRSNRKYKTLKSIQ